MPLVFAPENMTGIEWSHMEKFVRNNYDYDVILMRETKNGKPGIFKSDMVSSDYQINFEDKLIKDEIRISDCFFTTSKDRTKKRGRMTKEKILKELKEQLLRFQWRLKEAPDEFGNARYKLTGKIGGMQDDGAIVAQMLVYCSKLFYQKAAYKKYRNNVRPAKRRRLI